MSWSALGAYRSESGDRPMLVVERGMFDLQALADRAGLPILSAAAVGGLVRVMEAWPTLASDMSALVELARTEQVGFLPTANDEHFAAPFRPARIFAAASNYIEHANEMGTVLAGFALRMAMESRR